MCCQRAFQAASERRHLASLHIRSRDGPWLRGGQARSGYSGTSRKHIPNDIWRPSMWALDRATMRAGPRCQIESQKAVIAQHRLHRRLMIMISRKISCIVFLQHLPSSDHSNQSLPPSRQGSMATASSPAVQTVHQPSPLSQSAAPPTPSASPFLSPSPSLASFYSPILPPSSSADFAACVHLRPHAQTRTSCPSRVGSSCVVMQGTVLGLMRGSDRCVRRGRVWASCRFVSLAEVMMVWLR